MQLHGILLNQVREAHPESRFLLLGFTLYITDPLLLLQDVTVDLLAKDLGTAQEPRRMVEVTRLLSALVSCELCQDVEVLQEDLRQEQHKHC